MSQKHLIAREKHATLEDVGVAKTFSRPAKRFGQIRDMSDKRDFRDRRSAKLFGESPDIFCKSLKRLCKSAKVLW
jgi:hypothetical protein